VEIGENVTGDRDENCHIERCIALGLHSDEVSWHLPLANVVEHGLFSGRHQSDQLADCGITCFIINK
jgi:hypothetical protein